jgi:tetratricopeptide (TPR) repeat protein
MWDELNKAAVELFQSGKYAEAMEQAKKALEEAETTFGTDDPRVATSLNNLAEMYRAQVKYAEAVPLWNRALEEKKRSGKTIRTLPRS